MHSRLAQPEQMREFFIQRWMIGIVTWRKRGLSPFLFKSMGSKSMGSDPIDLLVLLNSPRFAQRPTALSDEVRQRISELRNDWGVR